MRLFVGIDLPATVTANLERLLDQLRPAVRLKWSSPANLHITTKFIGQWPEERLAELQSALLSLPAYDPIGVHIHRLGFFPNPHSPRVFWAGIEAAPGLASLAGETDRLLAQLGCAPEQRTYSPHLTLARIPPEVKKLDLQRLREVVAELPALDFGKFEADRFYLYLSRPGSGGSVYSKLAEFLLSK